jgi:hypothetical protein
MVLDTYINIEVSLLTEKWFPRTIINNKPNSASSYRNPQLRSPKALAFESGRRPAVFSPFLRTLS